METKRKTIIIILCCLQNTALIYAQWTKEDSVWLNDVVSGKKAVKINPEFQKAIEDGTLINTDIMSPKEQMKSSPTQIPIDKDFTEFLTPGKDGISIEDRKDINPLNMPPAVFMRYGLNIPLLEDKYNKAAFMTPQSIKDNAARPSGRSFDGMLQSIFSPSFRARERNRQNANAWKRYNNSLRY
ncbi:hypothetical protein M2459_001110 [Parabacteroides sp. PF5-5]|uniref:DUF4858 domain-containing protein n=1 Tax=unclassified Parabacteroides TaxID=2649774 RepID=UPI0024755062|nr:MULTISPECIES: DUF4858 domain-containing protein [unclassified Parabacteroides]MDH6304377.1 hypothetical protein [Parabacteroides sp. PH5-39]MDH6315470.1 hypothetical protein [Parabacteroides sp. PF5-13]MDH6319036.1 hypothetical protein [Parabacteroides sp. PH5-13]MDH6322766.1 hypothetical protein [Parabacteroides sp. PH5-8]MDH6326662.1 hypothetical protein [Parabacteroides sp. PH5-41]